MPLIRDLDPETDLREGTLRAADVIQRDGQKVRGLLAYAPGNNFPLYLRTVGGWETRDRNGYWKCKGDSRRDWVTFYWVEDGESAETAREVA